MRYLTDEPSQIPLEFQQLLKEIDTKYFPTPWQNEQWDELFTVPNCNYFTILSILEDELIGFALFKIIELEKLAHLLKLVVIPDFRGKQKGLNLLRKAHSAIGDRGISAFYLEVEVDNMRAISIYEGEGYKRLHRITGFYGKGRDCFTMRRD